MVMDEPLRGRPETTLDRPPYIPHFGVVMFGFYPWSRLESVNSSKLSS